MSQSTSTDIASTLPVYIAKSNLCLNSKGEKTGHGLFAGQNLGAGKQVISFERPLVGSLDTERLSDTCANCYIWTEGSSIGGGLYVPEGTNVQKCARCQRFRYCGKVCQKEAWNRGHKHECKLLGPMADRELPKAVLACMELLIRRKCGLISDGNWEMLGRLQSHVDDFKRNGKYENMELMAMGVRQFSLTQDLFDQDFVAAMYARVLTNSLTLITPTLDPLGIILDPTLAHINHSCDPNAYVMMNGSEVSIRTLKSIQHNEEICISYIDNTNPFHRRQSELKSRWFFDCKCTKCQLGATLEEDKWAIEPKNMGQKTKDIADAISKHEPVTPEPANYVGESNDEKRVAVIQGQAFAQYEQARQIRDAAEAIQAIEDALQLCHQSGLWPLHRQPYAALRDDFIVHLLSANNYTMAWAHCAKRYKHILPHLYPIPSHPVRVIQTWQMAMLAAYIASTEEGLGLPGVNMGLIAMMLVKQVLDATEASHGHESGFSQSVRRKAGEMMEEVKKSVGSADAKVMNEELQVQRDMLVQMGDWAKI